MDDQLPLFEVTREPAVSGIGMQLISEYQRSIIRELFAQLAIRDAATQFAVVEELTQQRIVAVGELTAANAHRLIKALTWRVENRGKQRTGNAWIDRESETWIDKL